ncbi:DUF2157 domain-containing protein [Massilia glaciei]|uniref:DUF2157 domain-containing protein n=1 Tax=Massilia glaciei TaxID=1524097 RepID=A0A2U2HMK9_9BURK|nr:DUF2157 domain-containing protein [Massilia glaciei]PWF48740.1 DUF2157 domain-containing protein [Massilia glaciei]
MDLRLALHHLAAKHNLAPADAKRLLQLAQLEVPPQGHLPKLAFGVAIAAAALGGLGIVIWVAANWDSLGRTGRFVLLESFVVVMCVGALLRPAARAALSLLAFLAIGGLFAYFGQTYQTGADAWQLFALWAVLSLPLCLAVRSDVLWAPWALVTMTAISLWVHAHTGNSWRIGSPELGAHLLAWAMALALTFALSPLLQQHTGAGPWALRAALILAIMIVVAPALMGLFSRDIAPQYWLGLAALAGAAACFSSPKLFDVFGLSAVGLALDILLVSGVAHLVFDGSSGDHIGALLLVGLFAAGLLAATVSVIMRLARNHETTGVTA